MAQTSDPRVTASDAALGPLVLGVARRCVGAAHPSLVEVARHALGVVGRQHSAREASVAVVRAATRACFAMRRQLRESTVAHTLADERLELMRNTIGTLPALAAEVVSLRIVMGQPLADIASELGISVETVRRQVASARGLVAEQLGDDRAADLFDVVRWDFRAEQAVQPEDAELLSCIVVPPRPSMAPTAPAPAAAPRHRTLWAVAASLAVVAAVAAVVWAATFVLGRAGAFGDTGAVESLGQLAAPDAAGEQLLEVDLVELERFSPTSLHGAN